MALTPFRWIALALAGFALAPVIVFFRPERPGYRWTERDRLQSRAGRAQARLRTAAERVRTGRLADSVTRSLIGTADPTHRVMFDRMMDSATRRLLADVARDAGRDRSAPARVVSDIVFVVDTVQMIDGVQRRGSPGAMSLNYILPRRGTQDRCIVIARVKPWGLNEFSSEASRDRLLGPCAFYEAFGIPGAAIERWLRNGGWTFAQMRSQRDAGRWKEGLSRSEDYPLRYVLASRGVSCATGNLLACREGMEHPDMTASRARDGLLVTEFNPYLMTSGWYWRDWSFGPRAPSLLADMAKDVGPDRFARFWRSELEPAEAFRTAAAMDLSQWTHEWLVRTYHEEKAGPGLSGEAWGWGLAILALSLGIILRTSERRQMA